MSQYLANKDEVAVVIGGVKMVARVVEQEASQVKLEYMSEDDVYIIALCTERATVTPRNCQNLSVQLDAQVAAIELGAPFNGLATGIIYLRDMRTGG